MNTHILLEEPGTFDTTSLKLESTSGHDFWYNPHFMQAISTMHEVKALLLRAYKGDELVAILPLYERRKFSLKSLICPVGAYYQGLHTFFPPHTSRTRVLLDTCSIAADIAAFLNSRYPKIKFKLHPDNLDVRGFTWNKLKAIPLYTFVHDTGEELRLLPDEKKSLKKAHTEGMVIKEDFDPDSFFTLQSALDKRKNHSLGVSYAGLKAFMEYLHTQNLLRQFNVIQGTEVVSTNILYYDGGKIAYSVFKASKPEAMKRGAATLHSVSLVDQMPQGCLQLDFCGANIPDIARFKAALGLSLKVFYQISS